MSFHRRIRTIYAKELVDILRDRRTLIAMIVVPILLYPLLMLGSIQAVSYQAESLGQEAVLIGVVGDVQRMMLSELIRRDKVALAQSPDPRPAPADPADAEAQPKPLDNAKIAVFGYREELEAAIRERRIHVGIVFDSDTLMDVPDYARQVPVKTLADREDMRSDIAERRLAGVLERANERLRGFRLERERLPGVFVEPYKLTKIDLAAPTSILGQILPLILILMTITGAIYPAIDLTAGERERGTLESLMVSPVPVIDLITGKFLVVTTVAVMGAALNLASVSATVYFGGFHKIIAGAEGEVPLGKMVFILLSLIPFAVLMSAIMIAVCSFARTFKEAQNYVTPVILAVLIPGGIAALPATRLEGVMLVMPVGNMVLLARDFLLGATIPAWNIVLVLLSTTLYAGAAVAVAAGIFGKESVVFADAGSLGATLSRRLIRPTDRPTASMGLLLVAVLFPVWFYVQSAFSPGPDEDASGLLHASGWLMPILFVLLPVGILGYWKVDVQTTLGMRVPAVRDLAGAVLIGLSAWVPAHEVNTLQQQVVGIPQAVADSAKMLEETLKTLPLMSVLVLIAVVPAICEELLFRGFLMNSLSGSAGKWAAIVVSGAVFGVFHFFLFKFIVTAALGVLLGYICWQSRSVVPAIVAHFLHNSMGVYAAVDPRLYQWIGIRDGGEWIHLPARILILGGIVFLSGMVILASGNKKHAAVRFPPT